MAHEVPKLPYDYDALEPHIDKETMQLHHDKHHQVYVDNLNNALKNHAELQAKPVEELLRYFKDLPAEIKTAVRNHGGGHANHSLFWEILKKDVPAEGDVVEAIKKKFGSMEKFKEDFTKAAMTQFGSGWAWLIVDDIGELQVINLPNQDSPLRQNWTPILGLDVWEHSYYKKYGPARASYVEAFWNVVNWEAVDEKFKAAKG
ncbi:MAG: superoxide dismutase [Candidatus Woesearchaeota archaeon]|nr:superoxide dismutase [Candidatus Woesearchaeota archaeon]